MAARIEIRTNGGVLDLKQNAATEFYVTRQIMNLDDFEQRKSDYTKYLSVPITPNNTSLLRDVSQTDKIECSIIMDGITIAPIAWLIVSNITDDEYYEIVILYGNFNLFDSLKGYNVADLNWADTDTDWELDILRAKSTHTYLDNDVVVPVADWYDRKSSMWENDLGPYRTRMDINTIGFFLYARNIMERMVSAAGYTLVVREDVPQEFNELALACPVEKFIDPELFEGSVPVNSIVFNDVNQVHTGATDVIAPFQYVAQDDTDIWSEGDNWFELKVAQQYRVTVQGVYNHHRVRRNATRSSIGIYRNGVLLKRIRIRITEDNIPFYVSEIVAGVVGDRFTVKLHAGRRGNKYNTLEILANTEFTVSTLGSDTSRMVHTSEHIPEINQATFFTSMLKFYNLQVITDDMRREVIISPFDSIYTTDAVDLSKRISIKDAIDIDLHVDSIGANSIFQWENDDLLRRDTKHVIEFRNNLIDREKIVLGMPFSACDNSSQLFNGSTDTYLKAKIPLVDAEYTPTIGESVDVATDGTFVLQGPGYPAFEVGDFFHYSADGITSGWHRVIEKTSDTAGAFQMPITESTGGHLYSRLHPEANTFSSRLAIVRIDGGEDNYHFQNGTPEGSLQLLTDSRTANWMNSLRMIEVTENQYKQILDALHTPQKITAKFNLTAVEVLTFDLRKGVYLSQYNAFYYVNKIDKFKVDELTTLELIRISKLQ